MTVPAGIHEKRGGSGSVVLPRVPTYTGVRLDVGVGTSGPLGRNDGGRGLPPAQGEDGAPVVPRDGRQGVPRE